MQQDYISSMNELEPSDRLIITRMTEERGVSEEIVLAALYKIVHEFQDFQIQNPNPLPGKDYYRYLVKLGFITQPSTS